MEMRKTMIEFLNKYRNDFLTVARFAEYHGLTEKEAHILLDMARVIESHPHPDM